MQTWVALFYSVVLSPTRRMKSTDLLEVARVAGLHDARTVLSTGNLIGASVGREALVERRLERAVESVLGRRIPVFCRLEAEWRALLRANPFARDTARDPTKVAVRVMREVPSPEIVKRIEATKEAGDRFCVRERALWLVPVRPLAEARLARAVNAKWAGEGTSRSASALAKIDAALAS